MKRIGMIAALVSLITPLLYGNCFALNNEEATGILKELMKTEFKILEIREAPLEGFWEVVSEVGQDRMIIYLDKNLKFIITGQILDRQTKRNLTLDRLKEFRKVDAHRLPLENAISMGGGKRKLYVFTDPQCHFCSQLHEELKLVKDLQTFFFLFPLTPASYEKAKSIWCSQDRLKALEESYHGNDPGPSSCDVSAIDRNLELGKHLLITSTPTLLFQNGKVIEGYLLPDALERLLKSSP
ncbi:MAG: DsbC family protein [Thermodesulfobacteriota bacterium]